MKTFYKDDNNYLVSGKTFNQIAQTVNWVNENQHNLNETQSFKSFAPGEIRINYSDDAELPMFSAVKIKNNFLLGVDLENGLKYETPTFSAQPFKSTDSFDIPFAISTEPLIRGAYAKAILTGIVPAKVNIKNINHQYVQPIKDGTGKLESCDSGTAKILYQQSGTGEKWCIILLGAASVNSAYNGYFTIKTRNGKNGKPSHIVVCDGATYDANKHTSGYSTARVGGEAFRVDYFETDIKQGNYLVFLKYTAGSMDVNGNVTQKSKVEICVEKNSDVALNSGDATFLIGDVNFQDGTVAVIQRFQGQPEQTPYITWYVNCSDFTDYILGEKSTEAVIQ